MKDMVIVEEFKGGVLILKISGEITSSDITDFENILDGAVKKAGNIIIDISLLAYICSAAIASFLNFSNKVRHAGKKVVILGANEKNKRHFAILGLPQFLPFVDNIDDAMKSF
jgi:anti-anti-sigma factor